MLCNNDHYTIELCNKIDVSDITKIYNSNVIFLYAHINQNAVSEDWVQDELKVMKNIGFQTAKIIDKVTNETVGFIDFKLGNEVYLSLFMLDGNKRGKGLGHKIYTLFENYLVQNNCESIRIDVINNYEENVIGFWNKQGFSTEKEIKLEWNGKESPAYLMRKKFKENE